MAIVERYVEGSNEISFASIDYQISNPIRRHEAELIVETTPAIMAVRLELSHYGLGQIAVVLCERKDKSRKIAAEFSLKDCVLRLYYQDGKLQKESDSTVFLQEYYPREGRIEFTPRHRTKS